MADTERIRLETIHGQVWDTQELQTDFTVQGFAAPSVICTNKESGKKGTLTFQHRPRFYFDWKENGM